MGIIFNSGRWLSLHKVFYFYFSFLLSACLPGVSSQRFTIVTTTTMLADAVKNIVREDVDVVSLMGPGIDPHTYQATQKDVQRLIHADMIFYNGLGLEGKMAELLEKISKERRVYAVGASLDKEKLIFEDIFPVGIDPHIWFDVGLWKEIVAFISQKLQEERAESAGYYQSNTAIYLEELEQLHQEVYRRIQSIPERQRMLITAHDAFSYFGKAYNIEVVGLQGISTASECGLRDINRVVQLIKDRDIKAVFF